MDVPAFPSTQSYEFICRAHATDETTVRLAFHRTSENGAVGDVFANTEYVIGRQWTRIEGTLDLPADCGLLSDELVVLSLSATGTANLVFDRVLLYPDDHVDRADPEVIDLLSEADLPLLRWPGGNFVSGYVWRDGVGPYSDRPTRVNPDGVVWNPTCSGLSSSSNSVSTSAANR